MAKSTDIQHDELPAEVASDQTIRREEIRQALLRLRKLGEGLPTVDAVEVIREGA
jgi:hypothetical protein